MNAEIASHYSARRFLQACTSDACRYYVRKKEGGAS